MMDPRPRLRWMAACFMVVVGTGRAPAGDLDDRCIECHSQAAMALLPMRFSDGQEVVPHVDKASFLQSAHGELGCRGCHPDSHPEFTTDFIPSGEAARDFPDRGQYTQTIYGRCRRCHIEGGDANAKSISQVLHSTAGDGTPLCGDCHAPHTMAKGASHEAVVDRQCANCHQELYAAFSTSVHGEGVDGAANPDLPRCTSCHFGHEGGGKSLAAQRIRMGRPCMGCHDDEPLMRKYGLSNSVVSTYLDDFHGVSLRFYGDDARDPRQFVLVCADCHGIHDVQPASGKAAPAMIAGLSGKCRKCHPDATDGFATAWLSHSEPSLSKNVLVYLVRIAYLVLIPFVITGLLLHIFFHLVVLPIRTRLGGNSAPSPDHSGNSRHAPSNVPEYFVRFSPLQRAQHLMVIVTFVVLVVTGLPQKFHDAAWAAEVVRLFGGIDAMRLAHRVAGYALAGVAVIHLLTVVWPIVFKGAPMTMLPTRKDFEDTAGSLKYYLGLADRYPKADRFDYAQKFEYLGMVIGTIVMVVTGFMLIFPALAARYIPGLFLAVAREVHSYEAMMALLTIVIWHTYGFRFDTSIFTGKISRERLAHHHPLEYERLIRCNGNGARPHPPVKSTAGSPANVPEEVGQR